MIEHRKQITDSSINKGLITLTGALNHRLEEKGYGTFASRHEVQGIITEEYHELIEALKSNNTEEFRAELLDLAVACVFGVICIDSKTMDW